MKTAIKNLFLPFMFWAADFATAFAIAAAIDGMRVWPTFAGAAVMMNVAALVLSFRRIASPQPVFDRTTGKTSTPA